MDKEQLFDKIIYLTGYFKGIANVLRSSGNVDPLALSADFESISRDMALIQNSLVNILYPEEEETTSEETEKESSQNEET
jgi:hypothetical protein